MKDIIEMLISYFGLALIAAGAQNAVFTRALGISSGLRMLHDSKKSTGYFCAALTVFQLMTVVIVYFVLPLVDAAGFGRYRRFVLPAIVVVACTVSYIIVIVLLSFIMGDRFKDVVRSVTSASINSAIVGTVILTVYQGLDLGESICSGQQRGVLPCHNPYQRRGKKNCSRQSAGGFPRSADNPYLHFNSGFGHIRTYRPHDRILIADK